MIVVAVFFGSSPRRLCFPPVGRAPSLKLNEVERGGVIYKDDAL